MGNVIGEQSTGGLDAAGTAPGEVGQAGGWLDRPLAAVLPLNWESIAWIVIFIVGIFTRFYRLGERAMSHDESLHTLYSYYLYNAGNYEHNPMMHGPFLFHANALMYFLFGDNDATARVAPALAGLGVLGLAYLYRRYIGRVGALVAGVLLLVDPTVLYHSRYIRDDIYIAFFSMAWVYCAFRYVELRSATRMRWLLLMSIVMAFAVVTMENSFIFGAIIGAFFAGLALWQIIGAHIFLVAAPIFLAGGVAYWFLEHGEKTWAVPAAGIGLVVAIAILLMRFRRAHWAQLRRSPVFDLPILMLTLVLPFTAPFGHSLLGWDPMAYAATTDLARSAGLVLLATALGFGIAYYWFGMRPAGDDAALGLNLRFGGWLVLMGVFWLISVLFFTTFLTNTRNGLASGIVGSLGYWLAQQEVARGGQPWYYYPMLGLLYAFLPMALTAGGTFHLLVNLRRSGTGSDAPEGEQAWGGWDPVLPSDLPASAATTDAEMPDVANYLRVNRIYFVVFGLWWVVLSWLAYTLAGEKMPWLLTHIVVPMCVFGGWWFGSLLTRIDWRAAARTHAIWLVALMPALLFAAAYVATRNPFSGRTSADASETVQWVLGLIVLAGLVYLTAHWAGSVGWGAATRLLGVGFVAVLFLFTIRFSVMLNYINFDMATEYLVYAHGSPDIKRVMSEIDLISERTVGANNIVVAYDDASSWPMSWYMRDYPNARYYGESPNSDSMSAPVVLVGPKNYDKVRPYLARDYVKRTYRRIWWPDQGYFNLTWQRFFDTLRDPAKLRRIYNIVMYRRYYDDADPNKPRDLSQWPTRDDMEMYVRKDIAAQIWDLGVTPMTGVAGGQAQAVPETDVTALAEYTGIYGTLPLTAPRDVAVAPAGQRVIADTGNHRIVVLGPDGAFVTEFGSLCRLAEGAAAGCVDPDGDGPLQLGDGQFYEPWGVAVGQDGEIFVADTWNGRIQVFDAEGNFLRKWGYFNTTNGELGDPNAMFGPRGLAIDAAGNLLVADTGNKRILQFSPAGALVNQTGGGGVILGRFEEPTDVAVDPRDGSIFVADNWNQRIQKLDPALTPLAEWAVPGWLSQDINDKPSVTVATNGDVYASDPESYRVLVFDPNGTLKGSFGAYGVELDRFARPLGLAIDPTVNQLLVADTDNSRVVVDPTLP